MKELKELFQKIDKENLKLEVQKILTNIRNAINDREDKLLLDIDNLLAGIIIIYSMIKL